MASDRIRRSAGPGMGQRCFASQTRNSASSWSNDRPSSAGVASSMSISVAIAASQALRAVGAEPLRDERGHGVALRVDELPELDRRLLEDGHVLPVRERRRPPPGDRHGRAERRWPVSAIEPGRGDVASRALVEPPGHPRALRARPGRRREVRQLVGDDRREVAVRSPDLELERLARLVPAVDVRQAQQGIRDERRRIVVDLDLEVGTGTWSRALRDAGRRCAAAPRRCRASRPPGQARRG